MESLETINEFINGEFGIKNSLMSLIIHHNLSPFQRLILFTSRKNLDIYNAVAVLKSNNNNWFSTIFRALDAFKRNLESFVGVSSNSVEFKSLHNKYLILMNLFHPENKKIINEIISCR